MSSSNRTLIKGFKEISTMADRLNLPKSVVDCANNLFKQVLEGKNVKGQSYDAIGSACLYIACRHERVPRTFEEICAVTKISKKKIGRCYFFIQKVLKLSVDLGTSGDFISRFCSKLGLPYKVECAATHIAQKAVELDILHGRSPVTIAAAAIYMASKAYDEKCSYKRIGDIAGVTGETIRQSYMLIYPHAAKLFPQDFRFAIPTDQLPQ